MTRPKVLASKFLTYGFRDSARRLYRKAVPYRTRAVYDHLDLFKAKRGLEIGGPTDWAFGPKGLIPIYQVIKSLDNVNFSKEAFGNVNFAAAEGAALDFSAGRNFLYNPRKPRGTQYTAEASELGAIGSSTYDFLLSSHMLEHTANPVKVLLEWMRIVAPGGCLLIIAPNKELTFDHKRPTTSLKHMIEDFEANRGEDDLTHLVEAVNLTDFAKTGGLTADVYASIASNNLQTRYIHHHTFTMTSLCQLLHFVGLDVIAHATEFPHHLIVLAVRR